MKAAQWCFEASKAQLPGYEQHTQIFCVVRPIVSLSTREFRQSSQLTLGVLNDKIIKSCGSSRLSKFYQKEQLKVQGMKKVVLVRIASRDSVITQFGRYKRCRHLT